MRFSQVLGFCIFLIGAGSILLSIMLFILGVFSLHIATFGRWLGVSLIGTGVGVWLMVEGMKMFGDTKNAN